MTDEQLSVEEGKHAHRICAQLLYTVTMVYLNGQWVVYFAARYTSHPTRLYKESLLYALRHFYGNRHIGLTLGGTGAALLQAEMHAVTPGEDDKFRAGTHPDSGFAESGPSTGGHTQDMGDTTTHSYCG